MTTEAPTSIPHGGGLFEVAREGQDHAEVTNIRRLAGTEREPGSVLVTAGMALLAMLDGGLLYVVFAAQDRFIFSVKHQNVASMIQALALDVAMIIFSVLALGLARKGLPANVERALIVVCALASAFMNWTASDHTSLRSVAVYVSAPILLALVTDRTISVVRRHVLGMCEDASVWARFGQRLGRAALWAARLLVDFRATRAGIRQAILRATPLPELDERAAEREDLDVTAVLREELATGLERIRTRPTWTCTRLREELAHHQAQVPELLDRQGRLELAAGASAYPTKKAHFMALYREHADYGAARPPAVWRASWPPGPGSRPVPLARTCTRSWPSWPAERGGGQVKAADVLLTLPFHHLYLDALAASWSWPPCSGGSTCPTGRWNPTAPAPCAGARGATSAPELGSPPWPSWFTSGAAWPPPSEAAGPAPA